MSATDLTHERDLRKLNEALAPQRDDFEKLLELAESLHKSVDEEKRRIEKKRIIQVVGMLFYVVAMMGFLLIYGLPNKNDIGSIITFALIITFCLIIFITGEKTIRQDKRRNAPDVAALAEVVQLLREVEPALTKSENWSYLDRVQFRIRLSRFGIGRST